MAVIEVNKWGEKKVKVSTAWWVDYYDENRRDSKDTERKISDVKHLRSMLEQLLKQILSWRKDDLVKGPSNLPYLDWHKDMTKKIFEKEDERYPIPKL